MNARLQEERYRQSQKRQAELSQDQKELYHNGEKDPVQSTYVSNIDEKIHINRALERLINISSCCKCKGR